MSNAIVPTNQPSVSQSVIIFNWKSHTL